MKDFLIRLADNPLLRFLNKALRRMNPPPPSTNDRKPWLAFYDKGVPPEIPLPPLTLNDFFLQSVKRHPLRTALIYFGNQISYGRLGHYVEQFAQGLADSGIHKGDRVALILPNLPQFVIAYWAALMRGALLVPMNPLCSPSEVETMVSVCRPKMIITFDLLYKRLRNTFAAMTGIEIVIASISAFMPPMTKMAYFIRSGFVSERFETPAAVRTFNSLFRRPTQQYYSPATPHDKAMLLFTGGVTGVPKAVLLRHCNLVANALQTRAWLDIGSGHNIILGLLPLFHSYGMTACHHLAFCTAATLILEPRFKASRAVYLMQKYHPNLFSGVPTMYRAVLLFLKEKKRQLRCSCICVSGGAPLPFDLKIDFEKATTARLIEGYGLTETSPITHCNPAVNSDRTGSIGLPFPNTEARIVDENGPVGVGEIGELQVRGPQVMSGYYENEAETRIVLSPDGWLSTGDMAKMDIDGFFYIVDRKKDLILYGGFNVYPSEVESVLNAHPSVEESAVIGLADDFYGQVVGAFVKCVPGALCSEDQLVAFCRDRLASFKVPREIVFVDDLPKNFIGKIVRRKLSQNNSAQSVY